jgi:hypothetical protein
LGFDTQDGAYPSSSIIHQGVVVGQTEKRLEILSALWGIHMALREAALQ